MTILFVDASAAVAIIAREPGWETLEERLLSSDRRLFSAMSAWETVAALQRRQSGSLSVEGAKQLASTLFFELDFEMVSIGSAEAAVALEAYERYGKGRHPARLNMGDCFAYACARTNGARLLYKGDDFAQTDMAA